MGPEATGRRRCRLRTQLSIATLKDTLFPPAARSTSTHRHLHLKTGKRSGHRNGLISEVLVQYLDSARLCRGERDAKYGKRAQDPGARHVGLGSGRGGRARGAYVCMYVRTRGGLRENADVQLLKSNVESWYARCICGASNCTSLLAGRPAVLRLTIGCHFAYGRLFSIDPLPRAFSAPRRSGIPATIDQPSVSMVPITKRVKCRTPVPPRIQISARHKDGNVLDIHCINTCMHVRTY